MKSGRIKWSGHEVCMGDMENAYKILIGNLKGRDHPEDLGIDWRIILKWILGK
jgi:hypothetical protein